MADVCCFEDYPYVIGDTYSFAVGQAEHFVVIQERVHTLCVCRVNGTI
eukprot:XP_001704939.1 Hypothetical protein GL50803_38250 [Giardia lamblia ATCC 50803]